MAGPRFVDWSHIRVEGDRHAAAAYVSEARKLMGYVQEDAARQGLGVHSARRELSDGTVIIAEKHGDVPRMTIIPVPPGGARRRLEGDDAFVVWPRSEDLEDGIDEEHPQLVLRFHEEAWRTYFFSSDIDGFDDFDRRKGTYRTDRGIEVFPDGLKHAGNIDWVAEDGVRLSWYGPSSRYFCDAYVQPRRQYGTKVFMLGGVLFDSDQYMADSDETFFERWVVGAALSKNRRTLYVVHAEFGIGQTLTGNSPPQTAEISNPFPPGTLAPTQAVTIAVCSYTVLRNEAALGAMDFMIQSESRQVLASGVYVGAYNPWFFNASATRAFSVGVPPLISAVWFEGQDPELQSAPSPSGPLYEFADGAIATRTLSAPPGGSGAVAVDFDGDTPLELVVHRRAHSDNLDGVVFAHKGTEYVGRRYTRYYPPSWLSMTYEYRTLVWADLREDTFVFLHTVGNHSHPTVGNPPPEGSTHTLELWHAGERTKTLDVPQNPDPAEVNTAPWTLAVAGPGTLDMHIMEPAADVPVAPIYAMYALNITISGGFVSNMHMSAAGLLGCYRALAYPPDHHFGHFAGFGSARVPFSGRAIPARNGSAVDNDGQHIVVGAASAGGATLLSSHDFFGSRGQATIHMADAPADDVPLPTLTGVDGDEVMFHPVWLLGAIPSKEVA